MQQGSLIIIDRYRIISELEVDNTEMHIVKEDDPTNHKVGVMISVSNINTSFYRNKQPLVNIIKC